MGRPTPWYGAWDTRVWDPIGLTHGYGDMGLCGALWGWPVRMGL